MTILENNLKLLKPYLPDAESSVDWLDEYSDIQLLSAHNAQMTMQFSFNNRKVYVHSVYNPEKEAAELADHMRLLYDSIIIVFGMGLLYHVKALLERAHPKCRILLIEPDYRVFARILREVDLVDIMRSGKVALSIAPDAVGLKRFLKRELSSENFIMIKEMTLPAYSMKYFHEYEVYQDVLSEVKFQRESENTTICSHGYRWTENLLRNIPYMPKSYRHWTFQGIFQGKPAVVVLSGPSLDKNVHLLAQLKGKVFIIAAYTCLNALVKHGIVPDVAVVIDGFQGVYEVHDSKMLAVPLLYVSTVDYRVLERSTGEKIFAPMQDDTYILNLYARFGHEEGLIFASSTVAVAATDFAVTAGCTPIIYIGLDLAFVGGQLHNETTYHNKTVIKSQLQEAFLTDDVFGGKVLTNSLFQMYKAVLEEYIRYCPQRAYIDATEGGVPIEGTQTLPFKQVIEQLHLAQLPVEIEEILKNHFSNKLNLAFDMRYAIEFYQEILQFYDGIPSDTAIYRLASVELVDRLNVDSLASTLEMLFAHIDTLARNFPNEHRLIRNRFTKAYGIKYANGALQIDGNPLSIEPGVGVERRAYIAKCIKIVRMVWILAVDIMPGRVSLITDKIRECLKTSV